MRFAILYVYLRFQLFLGQGSTNVLKDVYFIKPKIGKEQREMLLRQQGKLIWFTGLSGAGKSTLAIQLEAQLYEKGIKTYLLDGDDIRSGLNKDLTFSNEDRKENIRRAGEVCRLLMDAGMVVLSAFISPFQEDRNNVKRLVGQNHFVEVFVDAPLAICERRDVKGNYEKARSGLIRNFTGIDSPYEIPVEPDVIVHTDKMSIEDSVGLLMSVVGPRIVAE